MAGRKGYCKANDLCQGLPAVKGYCSYHLYRANRITKTEETIQFYKREGMKDHWACKLAQERLVRYREEMTLPKPTEPRKSGRKAVIKPVIIPRRSKSKSALKGTVRSAVNLFLQNPAIETATDAHAAIDRYAQSWTNND